MSNGSGENKPPSANPFAVPLRPSIGGETRYNINDEEQGPARVAERNTQMANPPSLPPQPPAPPAQEILEVSPDAIVATASVGPSPMESPALVENKSNQGAEIGELLTAIAAAQQANIEPAQMEPPSGAGRGSPDPAPVPAPAAPVTSVPVPSAIEDDGGMKMELPLVLEQSPLDRQMSERRTQPSPALPAPVLAVTPIISPPPSGAPMRTAVAVPATTTSVASHPVRTGSSALVKNQNDQGAEIGKLLTDIAAAQQVASTPPAPVPTTRDSQRQLTPEEIQAIREAVFSTDHVADPSAGASVTPTSNVLPSTTAHVSPPAPSQVVGLSTGTGTPVVNTTVANPTASAPLPAPSSDDPLAVKHAYDLAMQAEQEALTAHARAAETIAQAQPPIPRQQPVHIHPPVIAHPYGIAVGRDYTVGIGPEELRAIIADRDAAQNAARAQERDALIGLLGQAITAGGAPRRAMRVIAAPPTTPPTTPAEEADDTLVGFLRQHPGWAAGIIGVLFTALIVLGVVIWQRSNSTSDVTTPLAPPAVIVPPAPTSFIVPPSAVVPAGGVISPPPTSASTTGQGSSEVTPTRSVTKTGVPTLTPPLKPDASVALDGSQKTTANTQTDVAESELIAPENAARDCPKSADWKTRRPVVEIQPFIPNSPFQFTPIERDLFCAYLAVESSRIANLGKHNVGEYHRQRLASAKTQVELERAGAVVLTATQNEFDAARAELEFVNAVRKAETTRLKSDHWLPGGVVGEMGPVQFRAGTILMMTRLLKARNFSDGSVDVNSDGVIDPYDPHEYPRLWLAHIRWLFDEEIAAWQARVQNSNVANAPSAPAFFEILKRVDQRYTGSGSESNQEHFRKIMKYLDPSQGPT